MSNEERIRKIYDKYLSKLEVSPLMAMEREVLEQSCKTALCLGHEVSPVEPISVGYLADKSLLDATNWDKLEISMLDRCENVGYYGNEVKFRIGKTIDYLRLVPADLMSLHNLGLMLRLLWQEKE